MVSTMDNDEQSAESIASALLAAYTTADAHVAADPALQWLVEYKDAPQLVSERPTLDTGRAVAAVAAPHAEHAPRRRHGRRRRVHDGRWSTDSTEGHVRLGAAATAVDLHATR